MLKNSIVNLETPISSRASKWFLSSELHDEGGSNMGKVRPAMIKRTARELIEKFPDEITTDFEKNKRIVEKYTNITSKKVRNRVAGYLVRLAKLRLVEGVKVESEEEAG